MVFALDASGSIEKENFFIIEDFVRDVIFGLSVESGTQIGVLTYSTGTDIIFNVSMGVCYVFYILLDMATLYYGYGPEFWGYIKCYSVLYSYPYTCSNYLVRFHTNQIIMTSKS